jgi:soluble lytic murein transglycosylase
MRFAVLSLSVAVMMAASLLSITASAGAAQSAALPSEHDRAKAVAEMQQGLRLSSSGDVPGARAAFMRAATAAPLISDWAHMLVADAHARGKDAAGVRRALGSVGSDIATGYGWRFEERALRGSGDMAGAAAVAERAARAAADANQKAAAFRAAGDARRARGEHRPAMALYMEAMRAAPRSVAARDAATEAAKLPGASLAERLQAGRILLNAGAALRGVSVLEAALTAGAARTAADSSTLHLEVGRALFHAREYRRAETHLSAAARIGASSVAAEASMLAARSAHRRGEVATAKAGYTRTAERFPKHWASGVALYLLGDIEADAGNAAAAQRAFQRAALTGGDADEVALAAIRAAGTELLAGRAGRGLEVMEGYLAGNPTARRHTMATYWAGRMAASAGDSAKAGRHLRAALAAEPFSAYGVWAASRLGVPVAAQGLPPGPQTPAEVRAEAQAGVLRVAILTELGLEEAAAFEMERVKARVSSSPGGLYAVADALLSEGRTMQGALLGREIFRAEGQWNDRLLRIVYPFPFRSIVEAEAARHGLEAALVAGLIRQESLWNPTAVSSAGAIGLMQLMPATATSLASRQGIPRFMTSMLRDPATNVRLGCAYLAEQMRLRNGRLVDVFAAYNAGPSRLARWRELPEYAEEDLFAERIPFAETRDYVKVLQANRAVYDYLIRNPAPAR